jgi:hypothetical protein
VREKRPCVPVIDLLTCPVCCCTYAARGNLAEKEQKKQAKKKRDSRKEQKKQAKKKRDRK